MEKKNNESKTPPGPNLHSAPHARTTLHRARFKQLNSPRTSCCSPHCQGSGEENATWEIRRGASGTRQPAEVNGAGRAPSASSADREDALLAAKTEPFHDSSSPRRHRRRPSPRGNAHGGRGGQRVGLWRRNPAHPSLPSPPPFASHLFVDVTQHLGLPSSASYCSVRPMCHSLCWSVGGCSRHRFFLNFTHILFFQHRQHSRWPKVRFINFYFRQHLLIVFARRGLSKHRRDSVNINMCES